MAAAAQELRRRRQGEGPGPVRLVGGDRGPVEGSHAGLRAAVVAAAAVDSGPAPLDHRRRSRGLERSRRALNSRVSVPLPTFHNRGDRAYRGTLTGLAALLPLLLVVVGAELAVRAWPSIHRFGFGFLWTGRWDPVTEVYGAGPLIFGTLVSSLVALLFAVPLALGVAIFLTEFAPKWLRQPVAFLVELLAAVPSVVYGVWGIFV